MTWWRGEEAGGGKEEMNAGACGTNDDWPIASGESVVFFDFFDFFFFSIDLFSLA